MKANLGRVQAQRAIEEGNFEHTDYRSVYGLYMRAYGDEQLADAARTMAAELLVKQDCGAAKGK